nr:hypothetical protein Iba_chr15bCG6600 [Ipomoea batatas]GMD98738.1 hypothetical protein Iba_chr15dCG5630 [Ipomoea batatas]
MIASTRLGYCGDQNYYFSLPTSIEDLSRVLALSIVLTQVTRMNYYGQLHGFTRQVEKRNTSTMFPAMRDGVILCQSSVGTTSLLELRPC